MEENIIGGVSPLKKSMRRGKSFGKGKRGAGDTRYKRDKWEKPTSGGTFTRPARTLPPPPQTPAIRVVDGKPVMNPNIVNNYNNTINQTAGGGTTQEWVPGTDDIYKTVKTKGTRRKNLPTYKQSWENMEDAEGGGKKNKYGKTFATYDDYERAAKKWNAENPNYHDEEYEEEKRVLVSKGKKGYYKTTNTGGNVTQTANITNNPVNMLGSPGKYKLGGYRFAKKFKKTN